MREMTALICNSLVFNIETFDPVLRLFLTPGCEIVYMEELEPESDDDTRYLPKGPPTKVNLFLLNLDTALDID